MSDDPVRTAHEAAEILGVHYQTVRRYILDGELKAAQRGRRWFIRQSAIDAFLEPARPDVA
ncbi:MAG TPA: helix-turn-helix domain-containing protein [Pseudonocardia sp.]|jgi:excisionase family DNA binding protein